MATVSFEIDNYRVVALQSGPIAVKDRRILVVESPELPNGRDRLYLYFVEDPASYVSRVFPGSQPELGGLQGTAFCFKADFAGWDDILRNERPLSCAVSYPDPEPGSTEPSQLLAEVQLYTSFYEPPGEGPEGLIERLRNARRADPPS